MQFGFNKRIRKGEEKIKKGKERVDNNEKTIISLALFIKTFFIVLGLLIPLFNERRRGGG